MLCALPLLISALFVIGIPSVAAQFTGVVCINAVGSAGCPMISAHIPGQPTGTTLTIAVNIAGSDALSGVSVSILTDPMVLNPVSISTTGTVVPGPTLTVVDCVNGVPQNGAQCTSGVDGVGVASLVILSLGGITVAPTTGLLFTVTFNVLSAAFTTIGFQTSATNCSGQSVSATTYCVLIASGAAVLPETVPSVVFSYGGGEPPTISAPATATGTVGATLTIPVSASDSNPTEVVTLTATGLPTGATFTTTGTNPVSGLITWTPTIGHQSSTVMLTATDNEPIPLSTTASLVISSAISGPVFSSMHEAVHHLNLAKVPCSCQTFTATLTSNNMGTVYAQVMVSGTSGTASFTALSPITAISGVTSVVIVFSTANLAPLTGVKFHWTATIQYADNASLNGALTSPSTRSSAFAIV